MRRSIKIKSLIVTIFTFGLVGIAVPAFAQSPVFSDLESEIDAIEWAIVYYAKANPGTEINTGTILSYLELADKDIEAVMMEYYLKGKVTLKMKLLLHSAIAKLKFASKKSGADFKISDYIEEAIATEITREENRVEKYPLSEKWDPVWEGDMTAYDGCETVSDYLEVVIERISAWL